MKSTRILAGLAVSLLAFVGAVAAVETALRFTNPGQLVIDRFVPEIGRVRVPSQRGLEFGNERPEEWVRLTINAHGLRGEEFPLAKEPGEVRVLCMGDSFVFGGGLPDESTFPAIAETLYPPPPPKVRFLNAGGNGYDTRQSAAYAEQYAGRLSPDVLVLGFNWNDLVSIDFDLNFQLPPEWLRRFAIYKFWRYQSNPRQWQAPTPQKFQEYRDRVLECATGPTSARRWELVHRAIARLESVARGLDAPLLVLVMPELTWKETQQFPALRSLTDFLDARAIPWVDVQARFYSGFQRGEHLTQSLDPFHPSAEGQRIMAETVASELDRRGFVKWVRPDDRSPR